MGLDISNLVGQAEDAASKGMSDLLSQGGNAGLGFLEQQAINTIAADQAKHTAAYQASVANTLNAPAVPGSFSSYLSSITQGPIIQQYGIYIAAAVAVIVGATLLVRR